MNHLLDITQEHCPMTLVRTKLKLAQMAPGDTLELLLCQGEPLNNIPSSVEEQGYKVNSTEQVEGTVFRLVIEKPVSFHLN